jgi:hypothetical protein
MAFSYIKGTVATDQIGQVQVLRVKESRMVKKKFELYMPENRFIKGTAPPD